MALIDLWKQPNLGGLLDNANKTEWAIAQNQAEMAKPSQSVSSVLQNPQFLQALGQMGSAMLIANDQGSSFGGALGYGTQAFNNSMTQQQRDAMDQRLIEAKIQDANLSNQYGVRSQGFEGDIARAVAIRNDPNSTPEDKAVAEAVLQTAQRLQGSWDPVSGDYRWNPRARIGEERGNPLPASVTPFNPQSAPPADIAPQVMPPVDPSYRGTPMDMGQPMNSGQPTLPAPSFTPTGNRKVDAALMQRAQEADIAAQEDLKKRENERSMNRPKAESALLAAMRQMDEGQGKIDEAIGQVGTTTAGMGSLLKYIPGTEASDLDANLLTIRSGEFINALTEMRQNSPTGGAVGNVTDAEGKKLESKRQAVIQSQSPAQLKRNLEALKKQLEESKGAVQRAFQEEYGYLPQDPRSAPDGVDAEIWDAMTPEERALWQ